MNAEDFLYWLEAMRSAKGLNKSQCGALLGRSPQSISRFLNNGADRTVALACAALLADLPLIRANDEELIVEAPSSVESCHAVNSAIS